MRNFNKNEFKFEKMESWLKVSKITLRFNKSKKKDYYNVSFIKYNFSLAENEGWRYLNDYFNMNSFHREVQYALYEKVKYEIFDNQVYYTEAQTQEIVDWLEGLRVINLLTE